MRLTTVGYYADFAIGLALIAWLAGMEVLAGGSLFHAIIWLNYVALGFAVWTLVEYGVHRLIYHHVPFFERMHDAHHAEPSAFIGALPRGRTGVDLFGGLRSCTSGQSLHCERTDLGCRRWVSCLYAGASCSASLERADHILVIQHPPSSRPSSSSFRRRQFRCHDNILGSCVRDCCNANVAISRTF